MECRVGTIRSQPGRCSIRGGGYHDRYVVAPNYVDPSRGFLLMDDARRVVCIAPTLPTPRLAARLLGKYGTPLEAVVPSIDAMLRIPDEEA